MDNCPICKSADIKHKYTNVTTAPLLGVPLNGAVIPMLAITNYDMCQACGLVFQSHPQTDAWYDWYYSSGTYRQTLGITQEAMDIDEMNRAADVANWLKDIGIKVRHHIDVGSSRGYLLDKTRAAFGCKTTGIEKYSDYVLAEHTDSGIPDLVSAIHVLEHTTKPEAELKRYADMTSGYLLIETPGKDCRGGPLRFAHLYYFPPQLLMELICNMGFNIVQVESSPNTRILAEKIAE